MEIEMSKCMKESEDEQTTRKRKRKKVDRFVFLPDDILLDILKRVPDCFLRYKAKYVCRRWFNIITNKILLDHASFILQKTGTITVRVVDIREEEGQGLQVKEQDLDMPHKGIIRSWCNEFFLISSSNGDTLVSRDKVEIWVLKDFHRVKWEKLQSITDNYSYDLKSGVMKKLGIHIQHTPIRSDERCLVHSSAPSFK
ncbi:hypothetical protein L1887_04985 [Cichorium endivia]|nr:hypothetical protein L1887_04985 [Cichorium endivia]